MRFGMVVALLALLGQGSCGAAGTGCAATSLLSENADGYALAVVFEFTLGVVITCS